MTDRAQYYRTQNLRSSTEKFWIVCMTSDNIEIDKHKFHGETEWKKKKKFAPLPHETRMKKKCRERVNVNVRD